MQSENAPLEGQAAAKPVSHSLPALSFSSLHAYERCPRSVTYRTILRLPDVRPDALDSEDETSAQTAVLDSAESSSLLAAGDHGRLVHRALELWARRRAGADNAVREAAADLKLKIDSKQLERAVAYSSNALLHRFVRPLLRSRDGKSNAPRRRFRSNTTTSS
jgi:hypothetical protein